MIFQPDISTYEKEFEILKQQASLTMENWDDPVQRRFYEQFVSFLPKEFLNYINSLTRLDKSFKIAEQNIKSLL